MHKYWSAIKNQQSEARVSREQCVSILLSAKIESEPALSGFFSSGGLLPLRGVFNSGQRALSRQGSTFAGWPGALILIRALSNLSRPIYDVIKYVTLPPSCNSAPCFHAVAPPCDNGKPNRKCDRNK